MKFITGERHRDISYTIRAAEARYDDRGRRLPGTTKPLRAKFRDHEFDSVKDGPHWTDEEREEVEQYLLNHWHRKTMDRGRRLYVKDDEPVNQKVAINADELTSCAVVTIIDGEGERCSNAPVEGSLYCENHQPTKKEAA